MFKNSLKLITGTILVATLSHAEDSVQIGNWWEENSHSYPQTDDFLYHFEGEIGYQKQEGNVDSINYGYKLSAMARMEHVTSNVFFNATKSDEKYYADKSDNKGTKVAYEDYDRGVTLAYDFTREIYAEVGYINSKNTLFDIYNQTRMYAGVGYNIIATESHDITLFIAKGMEDTSYGVFPQYPNGETDAYLFIADYIWTINEGMSFSVSYEQFMAEKDFRDSTALNLEFTAALSESTFMSVSYSDKYNEMQKTVNKYTNMTSMSTSIGFSF